MKEFIAKIGKGQRTSKDLTWEEAKQAMRALIEGKATPAQTGAFLVAMRLKMESVAELAAFTAAAREYVPALKVSPDLPLVDVPTYAGKQETFHAAAAAAILAAAAGVAVLMHGYDDVPGRTGTSGVLAKLGVPVELDPVQVVEDLRSKGFAYLDLALYHPPIAKFLGLREELGLRSFVHPVAKLLNPARAQAQVIGITHPPYFEKTAEALLMLGARRALVLRGVEGEPELSLASITKVLEIKNDRIYPLSLQPRDVGLPMGTFRDMSGFPPDQTDKEALLLRRVLANEVRGGPRDWIVLNAAMLVYAAEKAPSISAAITPVQRALDSGAALQKLTELATTRRPINV